MEKSFKIALIGDILGGDLNYKIGWGIHSKYFAKNSINYMNTSNIFKNYEIVLGNLECPVSELVPKGSAFLGSNNFLNFLIKENLCYLTIANNHILDHGIEQYEKTKTLLKKNGIRYIGDSTPFGANFEIIEKHGIKIGLVGFNQVHSNSYIQNTYAYYDLHLIERTINRIKEQKVDYIIVSLHWGQEFINIPAVQQINDARSIINMGVDIIHGHHSHVIMPFEEYHGGYIFYCLGNFLMDINWWYPASLGMIAELEFTKSYVKLTNLLTTKWSKNNLVIVKKKTMDHFRLKKESIISNTNYSRKQSRIHRMQKLFSYFFLIGNFYKISTYTWKKIVNGLSTKYFKKSKI